MSVLPSEGSTFCEELGYSEVAEQSDLAPVPSTGTGPAVASGDQLCLGPLQPDGSTDMAGTSNGGDTDSVLSLAAPDNSLIPVSCTEAKNDMAVCDTEVTVGDVDVRSHARSRAGRLLKLVTRLVEIMHQRTEVVS